MGLFCMSIDLDELNCYHAIHGLEKPEKRFAHVVYKRGLPRLIKFLDELKIPATLFVVGRDLRDNPESGKVLKELANNGMEIANHSMNHRYDLTLLKMDEQRSEIAQATETIRDVVGVVPRGFRAPGYNIHLGVIELLQQQSLLYDSSVFPCPFYYSAKAAAIGLKSLRGKQSASTMGDPRVLMAPKSPYRMSDDGVWIRGQGMREFPITVVTAARIPMVGTFLGMMGSFAASRMAKKCLEKSFVNLEFHGIDFVDADTDGIEYLKEYQKDLRLPLAKRLKIYRRVLEILIDGGLEPATMVNAARRIFLG